MVYSSSAIIDIDGNNWSSRFGMLMCSNSVVIKVRWSHKPYSLSVFAFELLLICWPSRYTSKIEPDFIEYFYSEGGTVKPNIHYLSASLDNITQVVSFAMDAKNDVQMKEMIQSANTWCKLSLSKEGMARDSLLRLEELRKALDLYQHGSWREEWKIVKKRFMDTIDDFVDCDAWSIVDWFTIPMFAGL